MSLALWAPYTLHRVVIDQVRRLFPQLSQTAHKGHAGTL
jgi:hypothetical protein